MNELRTEARRGMKRIGEEPESVAEHTQRACMLGYLLAHLEGFEDPNLVVTMILFHDMHEARLGDLCLIQRTYIPNLREIERAVLSDQLTGLGMAGETMRLFWEEVEGRTSMAGTIAKDADILETAFTAREKIVNGNTEAHAWLETERPRLQTKSAQDLFDRLVAADPHQWWKDLVLNR
jgi:putative hydrolase of HD superfamily